MLEASLVAVGIQSYGPKKYRAKLQEARQLIEGRDPDDVPLLPLALALRIPVWSSDNDFANIGITRYTTAELLAKLGIRRE